MAQQCAHTKSDGSPCGAYAVSGSRYCFFHRGVDKTPEEPAVPLPVLPALESIEAAKRVLAVACAALWAGSLSSRDANAMVQIVSAYIRTTEGCDFERRLKELQEKIDAIPKGGRPPLTLAGES